MPLPSPGWAMQPRALGLTSWCRAPLCGRRLFFWCVRAILVTVRHPSVRGDGPVPSVGCELAARSIRDKIRLLVLLSITVRPLTALLRRKFTRTAIIATQHPARARAPCPCLLSPLRSPGCCTDRCSGPRLVASAQNAFRCWCETASNLPHQLVLTLHPSLPVAAAERKRRDAAAVALGRRARATRALCRLRHQRRRPVRRLALLLCRLSRAPP